VARGKKKKRLSGNNGFGANTKKYYLASPTVAKYDNLESVLFVGAAAASRWPPLWFAHSVAHLKHHPQGSRLCVKLKKRPRLRHKPAQEKERKMFSFKFSVDVSNDQ
jgi:hypothetical protein